MRSFNHTITDPLGLHARPAGILAKKAREYESTITIRKDGKEAQAQKLIAVMALGVKQGDEVSVSIEGRDENKIFEEVKVFFKENF